MQYFSVLTMFVCCVHIPMVVPSIIKVTHFPRGLERKSPLSNQQVGNDDAYSMCVKDAHRSLWPELQNGTMFILPRQLAIGDKICFNGSFYSNDKKWFNVRLVTGTNEGPDSQNIPVQINMTFPNGDDSRDEFEINSIVNGRTESFDNSPFPGLNATNLLDTTFSFRFEINDSREINIWLGATPDTVELRHPLETIKYLAITGDPHKIDKLEFIFANT